MWFCVSFQLFVYFHAWTCLERHFIRLLNLEHYSVWTEQKKNVWMAKPVLLLDIIWVNSMKNMPYKRWPYNFKSIYRTDFNDLVSFFLEEYIFIRLNQNIAYFAIEKYRKSTVPLFLGYAVYKKSHKPFLNFLHNSMLKSTVLLFLGHRCIESRTNHSKNFFS